MVGKKYWKSWTSWIFQCVFRVLSGCFLSGPVLRDTARLSQRYPPIARYGVFGASTWPTGCDTPPPLFWACPLLESMRSGGAIPPPLIDKRGISAILARYPMKTRRKRAIPPSAILSRKGIARYGGVSRTGPLRVFSRCFQGVFPYALSSVPFGLFPKNQRNAPLSLKTFSALIN